MPTASFYKFSKRKNSTKQPTGTGTQYSVDLKSGTSFISPTLLLNISGKPDYNYLSFEGRYYFITDIVSVRQDLWEISAGVDVLATYKTEILASTQFVAYSSQSGSTWLADTRIPLLKNATVSQAASTMNFLFTAGGFYVLAAVGEGGCEVYCTDRSNINAMIQDLSTWTNDLRTAITAALPHTTPADEKQATENLYTVMMETGIVGNAYLDAPNCIRSCIWVPFFISSFADGGGTTIKLGAYDTGATAYKCKTSPVTNSASVSIPWQHSDWRRATCEEVYLYLPLVGLVNVPSDEIINESSISVEWSATATDGCIAYRVTAGNQVIGTYGANASVNFPIGISQQASAGEIVQTAFAGVQKTVSNGISAVGSGLSGNVGGAFGSGVMAGFDAIDTAYKTIDIAMTRHNSCIGGIGGGAGVGLSLDLKCFTVSHNTVITPSTMQTTMGLPTMKPIALSTLTGYCECANAHVEAGATGPELNAIDAMINSGFFIE